MGLQLEVTLIGCFQAIVVAIIAGLFTRDSRKKKKAMDDVETRALLRAEESRLAMKLMSANVGLSIATAKAVKEGQTNGIMDEAITIAGTTKEEYYNFVNAVAAKQIAK